MRIVRAAGDFAAGARGRPPRGEGRVRRRRRGAGALRRPSPPRRGPGARGRARRDRPSPGARVLDPAAAPEGGRGDAQPRARRAGARDGCARPGVAAARAAGYVNAGTVEFLMDRGGAFYFLEMNTRLQVEHPVTESILGLDLVRLQIEVAAGRAPRHRAGRRRAGAATRWSAACTPRTRGATTFPRPGRVLHLVRARGPGHPLRRRDRHRLRGQHALRPLLAKVITWGRDRTESIERMAEALTRTAILGVTTNLALLRAIVAHPAFVAARCTPASSTTTSRTCRARSARRRASCPRPWRLRAAAPAAAARPGKAVPDPWAAGGRVEAGS